MTVKNLIKILQTLPMDEEVYLGPDVYEIDRIVGVRSMSNGERFLITITVDKASANKYIGYDTVTEEFYRKWRG